MVGVLAILYPLSCLAAYRQSLFTRFDLLPLYCLGVYLGIVLVAPAAPWGDVTEYQHRSFVVVYAVFFAWSIALAARAISARRPLGAPALGIVGMVMLAAAAVLSLGGNPAKPRMAWGRDFFMTPVDRGILRAASFIHARTQPGDILAVTPMDPSIVPTDTATRLASLTNVPTYLARPSIGQVLPDAVRQKVIRERLDQLAHLQHIHSAADAFATLRRMGVTWYLAEGPAPTFDPDRNLAVFSTDRLAVYRVERSGP
jgi:hypothetical protein